MRDAETAIRLSDYRPLDFAIDAIDLSFALDPHATRVVAKSKVRRVGMADAPLRLMGERVKLERVWINGAPPAAGSMSVDAQWLTLNAVPDAFELEIETVIGPADNLALEGLYRSNGRYCSQCEAEGFRKITYALDRPDNLAVYRVRIEADKESCPTLLSNGNLIEAGDLPDGRHYAVWRDPFPKPSYLFALVAGRFDVARDSFVTQSGRTVQLGVYVDDGEAPRALYTLDALKRSMRWDEVAFGREYDLDIFNIVAVRDFNFGAMENKGLNIFNAAYVLADADTATDADFEAIESIVGHEYFHNWTGNRITCRDWFQLSLKEGLTVFRDQEFSADQRSRPVQRIKDVKRLRARQFPEDAGPLAHAVRPASYVKIDNFYTATVYEKGAELIRMLQTQLGQAAFRTGMDVYFATHDGKAVTLEDFITCFEHSSGRDLSGFFAWYGQAGTPHVTARGAYDAANKRFTLALAQSTPPTPGQSAKVALPIPLRIGLLDDSGAPLSASLHGETSDEHLTVFAQPQAQLVFENVARAPIASIGRGFSAPIVLDDGLDRTARLVQMAHDPDAFTRWEAGQKLMRQAILDANAGAASQDAFGEIAAALAAELQRADDDPAFTALALRPPDLADLMQATPTPDPDWLDGLRTALRRAIAERLDAGLRAMIAKPAPTPFSPDAAQAGVRALRASCLDLLAARGAESGALLLDAFHNAASMSEAMPALDALALSGSALFDDALTHFYDRWKDNALVIDKWFSVQAGAPRADSRARIEALRHHPDFTLRNPNRARALLISLASRNLPAFHAVDGWGYRLLADAVVETDSFNPMLAGRLLTPFESWRRMDDARKAMAKAALETVLQAPVLSANAREMAERTLA